MSRENLGEKLRRLRQEKNLPLRKVAAALDIDVAILSKMERGERKLTKSVVEKLAQLYDHELEELMILFLSEKIMYEVGEEDLGLKAMIVAEEQVRYNTAVQTKKVESIEKKNILSKIEKYFQSQNLVTKAWVFGSFARGDEHSNSDIDIMVRFDHNKKITLFDYAEISHQLEILTERKIDLVEEGCLEPFALKTAEKDLMKIYG